MRFSCSLSPPRYWATDSTLQQKLVGTGCSAFGRSPHGPQIWVQSPSALPGSSMGLSDCQQERATRAGRRPEGTAGMDHFRGTQSKEDPTYISPSAPLSFSLPSSELRPAGGGHTSFKATSRSAVMGAEVPGDLTTSGTPLGIRPSLGRPFARSASPCWRPAGDTALASRPGSPGHPCSPHAPVGGFPKHLLLAVLLLLLQLTQVVLLLNCLPGDHLLVQGLRQVSLWEGQGGHRLGWSQVGLGARGAQGKPPALRIAADGPMV